MAEKTLKQAFDENGFWEKTDMTTDREKELFLRGWWVGRKQAWFEAMRAMRGCYDEFGDIDDAFDFCHQLMHDGIEKYEHQFLPDDGTPAPIFTNPGGVM